jgi:Na+/proline symporter
MPTLLGLKLIDLAMIVAYFAAVMAIGFWASRRVKSEEDFFLGGRRFGKGLLVMHWLCTGTHSDHAVQVAGATARVGLGGIWYQWMWLFATPFYWLIAPITRRLRVTTTGDVFRIRYGRGLEMAYSVVGLLFYAFSIAMLLRGAGAAISGATGGAVPTSGSVILLSVLFSTYVMAGGLVAAAYTDFLQGVMIIVLSVLLVPAGLKAIGGIEALHTQLPPEMMAMTAPHGAREGDPWFILAMSILSLVGIVAQPHVMSATGSGKAELEARVGMCYGNFIKRVLTIAWAFTGIIAVLLFPQVLAGLDLAGPQGREASETLFGRSIQHLLGDGWRGLMIACLIAGITSAETFMVVGSAIFINNFYQHVAPGRGDRHYLWAGRLAAAGMLAAGILLALRVRSVTQLLTTALDLVGLMGPAFWLGVTWRRANAAGVWASLLGGLLLWTFTSLPAGYLPGIAPEALDPLGLRALSRPLQVLVTLAVEFGLLIVVSLLTRPHAEEETRYFFARLHTPVGREEELRRENPPDKLPEAATLGMGGVVLDYAKASAHAYTGLQRLGIEVPRLRAVDWGGFLGAWALVFALIGLLAWLSGLGRP